MSQHNWQHFSLHIKLASQPQLSFSSLIFIFFRKKKLSLHALSLFTQIQYFLSELHVNCIYNPASLLSHNLHKTSFLFLGWKVFTYRSHFSKWTNFTSLIFVWRSHEKEALAISAIKLFFHFCYYISLLHDTHWQIILIINFLRTSHLDSKFLCKQRWYFSYDSEGGIKGPSQNSIKLSNVLCCSLPVQEQGLH